MKRIIKTLSEKWPEYLLEILVITIGILGAFALNNWNEGLKENRTEQLLLRQLQSDYQSNLEQLNQKIEMRESIIAASTAILTAFDQPKNANRDSLIYQFAYLLDDPTFDPIENNIINTGQLQYIRNQRLNKLISSWSSDIIALQEIEQVWSKMVTNEYNQLLNSLGVSRQAIDVFWAEFDHDWLLDQDLGGRISVGSGANPAMLEEILKSRELEGIASYAIGMNYSANQQSFALRRRIQEILDLTEQEIR